MFDTHVHFDAAPFVNRLDEVAERTRAAGVRWAANPAVSLASSRLTLSFHARHPWILPCLGIHPLYLEAPHPPLEELERLAGEGPFAAVGEVGLDFWHGRADEERQREYLYHFALLAQRRGLPLLLHIRKSLYETFSVLREAGFTGRGIVHAFPGSHDMARKALDAGFFISAAAILTYPAKRGLLEVFAKLPRDRVVVETDAPDLPPRQRRGETHNPWDLPLTVKALADAWGESAEKTAELTEENARKVFGV